MRPGIWLLLAALCACDDGGGAGALDDGGAGALDARAPDAAPDAAPEGLQDLEITVGDLVFDAIAAGPADGPPVLLLHGFPQTNHAFRGQVEALGAAGFRAVAPNQRGYSPRARPPDVADYALPLLADDVLGMADALGFAEFHLVGHDWGAGVVWYLAGTRPERLLTISPISVPHLDAFAAALADPDSDQAERSGYFTFFRAPTAQDVLLANDAAVLREQVWVGLGEADIQAYLSVLGTPQALGAALNWYRANDLESAPALGPIDTPTLYVWSDMDPSLGPDAAMATGDYVRGPYRFEVLTGANHWIPDLEGARLDPLLLEHLGR